MRIDTPAVLVSAVSENSGDTLGVHLYRSAIYGRGSVLKIGGGTSAMLQASGPTDDWRAADVGEGSPQHRETLQRRSWSLQRRTPIDGRDSTRQRLRASRTGRALLCHHDKASRWADAGS